MRYRDHKGNFDESMLTVIEVSSREQIMDHLNDHWQQHGKFVNDIRFSRRGFDARNGWETYYVLQKFQDEDWFTVAGWSDGFFPSPVPTYSALDIVEMIMNADDLDTLNEIRKMVVEEKFLYCIRDHEIMAGIFQLKFEVIPKK